MTDTQPKSLEQLKAELKAANDAARNAYYAARDAALAACDAYNAAQARYLKALESQEDSDD